MHSFNKKIFDFVCFLNSMGYLLTIWTVCSYKNVLFWEMITTGGPHWNYFVSEHLLMQTCCKYFLLKAVVRVRCITTSNIYCNILTCISSSVIQLQKNYELSEKSTFIDVNAYLYIPHSQTDNIMHVSKQP